MPSSPEHFELIEDVTLDAIVFKASAITIITLLNFIVYSELPIHS